MEVKLKDTLNSAWKNDKTGFGFRMLQKMGWSEEKGLGKNESGITENIKMKKREDGLGLGVEKSTDGAGNKGWSQTAASFNDVLAILKESYGKSKKSKKAKTDKSAPAQTISVGMK
jgi:Pin2-interacting protein X1